MGKKAYYIANNPDISASRVGLAMSAGYDRLTTAYMDMGGGVIFDGNGDIVAFHERHLNLIEHRGSARMSNFGA